MASKGDGFRSMSGRPETTEPTATQTQTAINPAAATAVTAAARSRDGSPVTIRHASSTSSVPTLRTQQQQQQQQHQQQAANFHPQPLPQGNTINSPRTSRNASPIRASRPGHDTTHVAATRPSAAVLRRSESQEQSPHRPAALSTPTGTVPSAAAIQRALSATSVPQLSAGSVTEAVSKLPKMQPRSAAGSGETTPTWPQSPRLKSPPPSSVRARRDSSSLSQRGTSTPSILVQTSTPTSSTPPPYPLTADALKSVEGKKEEQLIPGSTAKAPSRGPSGPRPMLETVEENTPPNGFIPQLQVQNPSPTKSQTRNSDEEKPTAIRGKPSGYISDATSRLAESESEGNKSDGKSRKPSQETPTMQRPKAVAAARTSYPALSSAKSRQPEGTRNMTVETETVASVPQTSIGGLPMGMVNERGRLDGGSLRLKPSTETIRPRKDRKRTSRKTPSINNGTASSKADIFEARVATQVDEQGSSSDETFVYESNTEPQERARRHHSRTPSVTSLHSQSDFRHGLRNYAGVSTNGDHRIAGKRSMKFSNNPYTVLDSPTDDGNGTVRAHARHIGRLGRTAGSGSRASLYGQDSPFTQAAKFRNSDRVSSRPGSPKSITSHRPSSLIFGKKNDLDIEGGEGDDERTPLVGTVRTPRNSTRPHGRRYNSGSIRGQSYYDFNERQAMSPSSRSSSSSRLSRFGGCLFGLIVFILVVLGAVGFLVMSNKPLYGFEIDRIENVLASEQEIMLDLVVGAVNPNVLGVTIQEMDLNIFAKSKYVNPIGGGHGGSSDTVDIANKRSRNEVHQADWQDSDGRWHPGTPPGEDEGTDPIEGDSQTMLLGRVFHFDSPLVFDGSPVKRHAHHSIAELRLAKPGNRTELEGSERWERVLQYPFDLILRGILKYQLPISSKEQTAAIGASVRVHPEEGVDAMGRMRVSKVDGSEKWQWIEFEDLDEHDSRLRRHDGR